jgi:hypothetical protein
MTTVVYGLWLMKIEEATRMAGKGIMQVNVGIPSGCEVRGLPGEDIRLHVTYTGQHCPHLA